MTAIEWLEENIKATYTKEGKLPLAYTLDLVRKAKEMEKKQLSEAMNHALDEDGHTGDWRIKFVNDYTEKLYNK